MARQSVFVSQPHVIANRCMVAIHFPGRLTGSRERAWILLDGSIVDRELDQKLEVGQVFID